MFVDGWLYRGASHNYLYIVIVFYSLATSASVVCSFRLTPRILLSGQFDRPITTSSLFWLFLLATLVLNPWMYSVFYFDLSPGMISAFFVVLAILGAMLGSLRILFRVVPTVGARGVAKTVVPRHRSSLELSYELRRRARSYRVQNTLSIVMILVALLVGAAVFVLADYLAAMEIETRLGTVVNRLRAIEKEQTRITETIKDVGTHELVEVFTQGNHTLSLENNFTEYQRQIIADFLLQITSGTTSEESSMLEERIAKIAETHVETEQRMASLSDRVDSLIGERENVDDTRAILSTLSTRVGSVFLVIFLVRIMTTLFRYSARMASHQEACADIFSLDRVSKNDAMVLMLGAEIGFDKEAKEPVSEVKDLLLRILKQ